LVRFAAVDGRLVVDPERTRPGRGAWLCRDRRCFEQAVARRAFTRALRTSLDVPPELLDFTD
jgi:predicted RNA-binding protein YlxR (DUF448 family)